jgi:alpha-tubulin suppressor-like RCC1 family protein
MASLRSLSGFLLGVAAAWSSSVVACNVVFGLSGYEPADSGTTDVRARDAKTSDAGSPPAVAVVVSSSMFGSDWCAVTSKGEVECWGNNESGELGDGTTTDSATPVKVMGIEDATDVAIDSGTACALTKAGAVYCWGRGDIGQLGNNTTEPFSISPVPVTGLEDGVTALSRSEKTACAVKSGALLCWGSNALGRLGNGQTANSSVPVPVSGMGSGVTGVSVGGTVVCAVKDGGAFCWGGFPGYGELGNNTPDGSSTPVPVQGLTSNVSAVSAGFTFACALTKAGSVSCWGSGTTGALGNGDLAVLPFPVQVLGLTSGVSAISAGVSSASAITTEGVVTWGTIEVGTTFNQTGPFTSVPTLVKGLTSPAISISTGQAPCVATKAGSVECWGIIAESALAPVKVNSLSQVTSVTAGGSYTSDEFACALSVSGGTGSPLSCWGGNGSGQLGNSTMTSSSVPVGAVTYFSGVTSVSAGAYGNFACGIASGQAYCWGANGDGQLGNGSTTPSSGPLAVKGLTSGVTAISAGDLSACAVTTTGVDAGSAGGAAYCWGLNVTGQLGNGTMSNGSVDPVPVHGLGSGVTAISVGGSGFACALLTDSTVECWGNNEYGQVGDGTVDTRLVPTKVMGLAGATAISCGTFTACAVTSGTIQCWGFGASYQLGNGEPTNSSTPVAVADITGGATEVAVGGQAVCAIVDGSALCWGNGPIGSDVPPLDYAFAPTQVKGLTSGVTSIAVGFDSACAVVNSGVQCWGLNTAGELGNGGAVDEISATPVVGFM